MGQPSSPKPARKLTAIVVACALLGSCTCIGIVAGVKKRQRVTRADTADAAPPPTAVVAHDAGPLANVFMTFGVRPESPHADEDVRFEMSVKNLSVDPLPGFSFHVRTSEDVEWMSGDEDIKASPALLATSRLFTTERVVAPSAVTVVHLVFRPAKAGRMRIRTIIEHAAVPAGALERDLSMLVTP